MFCLFVYLSEDATELTKNIPDISESKIATPQAWKYIGIKLTFYFLCFNEEEMGSSEMQNDLRLLRLSKNKGDRCRSEPSPFSGAF